MKANHIVHVSSYYPPHLGGQENVVYDLASQLAKAGHSVDVLTSSVGGGPSRVSAENGVRVRRMKGLVFGHAPIMPWLPVALWRTAKRGSIVHVHIGQAFTPEVVWLISKLRGFAYIAELHIDFTPSGPVGILLPLYKKMVLTRVLRAANAIITLNKAAHYTVRDTYGYTGLARIMNNGIDEAYFAIARSPLKPKPPKILRLLFVGRLSKQKNILVLLKALELTSRNVHLDIIGDGDEREAIEKDIADRGLVNVTLHGRLDRQQVARFYKTCDALVMPSLYEAQPLVLLEAMAARIPVIGTNVIGVADHLKGAGIIVEPTAEGIAAGLDRYYTDYISLPGMIERGYRIAQAFRWPYALKKYERLYEEVMGG